jgi:DNA-binding beta-propeller fold protein YncE
MKKFLLLSLVAALFIAFAVSPSQAEQYKLIKHFGCLDGWANAMKFPTGIFVQEGCCGTGGCACKGCIKKYGPCDDGVKYCQDGYVDKCVKVAATDSTKIYVADMWNKRIEKYDIEGNLLKRWDEKSPLHPVKPYDLVIDSTGSMHLSDQYYDRLQRQNAKGWNQHVVNPVHWNYAEIGTDPTKSLEDPRGMAIDPHGNIVVADFGYRRIFVFDNQRNYIKSFSTSVDGDEQSLPEKEKKDMDPMPRPIDVAVDAQGNYFVCYNKVFGVRKFDSNGQLSASFPKQLSLSGSDMILGGIALDSHGNIFVTDSTRNKVYKLNPQGNTETSWGRFGYLPGYFNNPMGIFVDSKERVYVVDQANSRVQIFAP